MVRVDHPVRKTKKAGPPVQPVTKIAIGSPAFLDLHLKDPRLSAPTLR
jgi:hypothetical protein